MYEEWELQTKVEQFKDKLRWIAIISICFLMLFGLGEISHSYTVDELATAIGKAENSKTHPYGIMVKYRHTTPRQACINTIKHQYRLWLKLGQQPFLTFLSLSYAPIGASNDPKGLNKNWERNVRGFLCHYSKA